MRRNWIKLYCDQTLRGSCFDELKPDERFIWFGFLLLAGDSVIDGKISLTENMGYTDEQIAALLKVDNELLRRAKKKMIKFEKIRVLENNVIEIINWKKYQSEYQRQKPYRESYNEKLQEKVTNESNKEKEIKKEKENRIENNNIKAEFEQEFEKLWKAWPAEGRAKKKYCRMKFIALCKKGLLKEFIKAQRGYIQFLEYQEKRRNFKQQCMYLSTFLNNWEEDKERYIGFEYRPRL